MPLALAAGGNAVWTVASLLVVLRDVYQATKMHNEQLCNTIKYDVHECILISKMHDMAIARKQLSQTNQIKQQNLL